MSRNTYKTAQGQIIDIDNLRLVNEGTIAVGNMKVNARGDQVKPDGSVIKTRNELMKDQYKLNVPIVKTEKSQFGKPANKRQDATLASSVAPPTFVEVAPKVPETLQSTDNRRGALAQSVIEPTTPTSAADDLQSDLETLKPKSKITRI